MTRFIEKIKTLVYIAPILSLATATFTGCLNDAVNRPNIIFILSDDLSYRDLSSYGQQNFCTPNIDRLALNGIRFSQAYSGACECAPSRASLMTGMHMGHCRIRANSSVRGQDHLLELDTTVAEILKAAGYNTAFIGKWGIGLPGTEGVPHKQGFDFAFGYYDQRRAHTFFPDYLMKNDSVLVFPENHGFDMDRIYKYNRLAVPEDGDWQGTENKYDANGKLLAAGVKDPREVTYSEYLFRKEAVKFIRSNSNSPFFLYYATQLPHGPVITPDLSKFKDRDGWSLKHKEWAAMVEEMDISVGAIIEALEVENILENTVIFFAGDNGYSSYGYFGRPGWQDDMIFKNKGPWPKGKFTSTREGGLQVPFFVYWKGRIVPEVSYHLCALYDFPATAADIAGIKPPVTDGISLYPTLTGNKNLQQKHEFFYWENGGLSNHTQSVRYGKWWACREKPSDPPELYDLTNDLGCTNNLAESNPDVIRKILGIMAKEHQDSKWYTNPGEVREQIEQKRQRAIASGGMQESRKGNQKE